MNNYSHKYRTRATTACPQCRHVLDAATGGDNPPALGDLTVCAYCATPLKFLDDAGNVARLEADELAGLPDDERREVLRVVDAARLARRLFGRLP
jgi:hypothetical protein